MHIKSAVVQCLHAYTGCVMSNIAKPWLKIKLQTEDIGKLKIDIFIFTSFFFRDGYQIVTISQFCGSNLLRYRRGIFHVLELI